MSEVFPDQLDLRFERLRAVATAWKNRYQQLPEQVVPLFDEANLAAIAQLLKEKRALEFALPELQKFIAKWEDQARQEQEYRATADHHFA